MTRRKPLTWYSVGAYEFPACDECQDFASAPGTWEAVCSTAIERAITPEELLRGAVNGFHAARHRT